ncbi:MAG TPA: cytochrome c oxidase assembly protein [Stellaceae bacterium]|nr:cytochrome c oxidase assembly protein [Stellaceae bacterium]
MALETVPIPYCGLPVPPHALWSRWNLDPVLIAFLVLCALGYGLATRGPRIIGDRQKLSFYSGWAVLAAALMSPLCPLSVSLFAARVAQHMILVLIAAPLIVAGRPAAAIADLLGHRRRKGVSRSGSAAALSATGLFAALLWFWHSPGPYAATFTSDVVYWSMHVSMIGSALWLWHVLLDRRRSHAVPSLLAGLITSTQMSLLGAVITFAPHPLYSPHLLTTVAWGLTPLQDQQLGGAVMWVPGGVIFLAVAMIVLWSLIGARVQRPLLLSEP